MIFVKGLVKLAAFLLAMSAAAWGLTILAMWLR
jgi:hypothetical protein